MLENTGKARFAAVTVTNVTVSNVVTHTALTTGHECGVQHVQYFAMGGGGVACESPHTHHVLCKLQSGCVVGSQLTALIHECVQNPGRNAEAALMLPSKTYQGPETFPWFATRFFQSCCSVCASERAFVFSV